jgi:hypothetical protein
MKKLTIILSILITCIITSCDSSIKRVGVNTSTSELVVPDSTHYVIGYDINSEEEKLINVETNKIEYIVKKDKTGFGISITIFIGFIIFMVIALIFYY